VSLIYNVWTQRIGASGYKWDENDQTYKVILMGAGYSPNKDHNYYSEISGNEFAGTNYTPGGLTITGLSVVEEDNNDRSVYHAFSVQWNSLNDGIIYSSSVYRDSGDPTSSELVCWTSGATFPKVANGTNVQLSFVNGVFTISGS
jgi:hypothetical protein